MVGLVGWLVGGGRQVGWWWWVFSYSGKLRMIDEKDNELISQLPDLPFLIIIPAPIRPV